MALVVLAACSARVPAPVVFKGSHPISAPPALAAHQSNPRFVPAGTIPPVPEAARSKKLTLRGLIDRNRFPFTLERSPKPKQARARVHQVAAGETVYAISRRYGVDVKNLARANDLGPRYRIAVGQTLTVPSATAKPDGKPSPPARTAFLSAPPRAGSFVWPLKGKVLLLFGPQEGGRYNDGINIAGAAGSPVVASETGIVAYVGNDLEGLGNLILIRHAGGWVTAYAHQDSVLVERGAQVRKGDVIGLAGASGNVDRPQLHFEIRKGTEAVDPIQYLGARTAARPVPLDLAERPAESAGDVLDKLPRDPA